MMKIRFGMVGAGWRGEFFARIAQELPEQFELTGTWLHSPEKAEAWQKRFGGRIARTPAELLEDKPDFLVQAVAKTALTGMLMELMDLEVPILCETPPFIQHEAGLQLWEKAQQKKACIQIAEQYPLHPMFLAWKRAVDEGLLGEVSNINLSFVHSYHAASLIRRFLNVGFENAQLHGCRHFFPVQQSDSRAGIVLDGKVNPERRDRVTFVFDSGKTAFFDWGNVQYYSFIRSKHFCVQGTRGEIDGLTIHYLAQDNYPITQQLERRDFGPYNNNPLSHFGLMLGDQYLYRNPFPYARLNDDEIAMADCLVRMKQMLDGEHVEVYSLADAMQDAYIALKMEEALTNPWQPVRLTDQPWKPAK